MDLNNDKHCRPHLLLGAVCLFLMAMPLQAQMEPCGFFEVDGLPGQGLPDLWHSAQFWLDEGDDPGLPDHDGNGIVNILDLVRQASCVPGLNHGLAGLYYGLADGSPGQDLQVFPDFAALGFDPVVVRATEELNVLDGYRGFMDSDMRHNFGAIYRGYLFVPETATYTLHILGNRGMRVTLDGSEIMGFDSWPREDEATLSLSYGLHPLEVAFFTGSNHGRIFLEWSSNGTAVGSSPEVIGPWYFYHEQESVTAPAQTALELLFFPPSGTRVTSSQPSVAIYALGPDPRIELRLNGNPVVHYEGRYEANLSLAPGLNAIEVLAKDQSGHQTTKTYHLYYDAETLTQNGLAAKIHALEWYRDMPSLEGLNPLRVFTAPGTQMDETDGVTSLAGHQLRRGTAVQLVGTIDIPQDGTYRFRVDSQGGLRINGEFVGGINYLFPNQWDPDNEVYLTAGRHHYQLETYDPWSGPEIHVRWQFEGGAESLIPDSVFRYGSAHSQANLPELLSRATGSRVSAGQIVEYVFDPVAPFNDTNGGKLHLYPDPRAHVRDSGGLTYTRGGSLTSELAGVRMASYLKDSNAFSLEVDFVQDTAFTDWHRRNLVGLTPANWGDLATIYVVNDNLAARIENGDQDLEFWIDDIVTEGTRLHVVLTFDGSNGRLYVNGQLQRTVAGSPDLDSWSNLAHFHVGQRLNRRATPSTYDGQMMGTFLVAAAYNRALSQSEIQGNRSANITINPTPPALADPAVNPAIPGGTAASELDEAHHVLNRLAFGPSPSSLRDILTMGVDPWIDQQLQPDTIDDSATDAFMGSGYFIPSGYEVDFRTQAIYRMASSNRQLLEVMTQFWENHFNTQVDKTGNLPQELAENERFRSLAFGRFEDLLTASATHYPMTVYLDNTANVLGAPNENYAREVFELFGLGVNNGYTQDDIVEAARCFTGWSVRDGQFYFNPGYHDYGQKTVRGQVIPAGGGMSDGLAVIEQVANSAEAAQFITWKLCQLFVADDPPADIHLAAQTTFANTSGDIEQVLRTIFNHVRFRSDLAFRGNKTKTPLEFMVSALRISESVGILHSMPAYLSVMGMELFNYADPTGFAEEGVAWIDTNSLLNRWNLSNDLISNRGNGQTFGSDFARFIRAQGVSTSGEVLDLFENLTAHGRQNAGVRALAEQWLTGGDPPNFVLDDATIDTLVRQTFSLYLRLPEMNQQ